MVAAVLSPTDPVFAAAIVGRQEIPQRLRHLLNVESGFNDGLALPFVVAMLAFIGHTEFSWLKTLSELGAGVLVGVVVPLVGIKIESQPFFAVARSRQPLFALAIAMLVYTLSQVVHANTYLAAFSAGITIASTRTDLRDEFHRFGELIAEVLKLNALMVFGALLVFDHLASIGWRGYAFVFWP